MIEADYLTLNDNKAVLDQTTGLIWLDLQVSHYNPGGGEAFNDVAAMYTGYRDATYEEVVGLFLSHFGDIPNGLHVNVQGAEYLTIAKQWNALFGHTDGLRISKGVFRANTGYLRIAGAGWNNLSLTGSIQGANHFNDSSSQNGLESRGDTYAGQFLVKINSGTPPSSVPEPSTLAIFALGIMGLASRRFKKQS